MMVVHEDTDNPMEVGVSRKPLSEQKSYVIVKKHVRELINTTQNVIPSSNFIEKSPQTSKHEEISKKKRKSDRKRKKSEEAPTTSSESDSTANCATEIDPNDLNELKTIYLRCKEVMNKIETKYGHLLDLDSEIKCSSSSKKQKITSETLEDECQCKTSKKIVFDDEGQQTIIDTTSEKHICVKNITSAPFEISPKSKNVAVEYQDTEIVLPDSLQELGDLLHDPNIEDTYRNQVLDKMRIIKQEYVNEIRFNRHILIEKLKTNPDEVLSFKGSNLSTITGYS